MQTLSALCAISFVLVTVTFHQGAALRCFRCSSDSRGGEFCKDPFSPEKISEKERSWSFIECPEPPSDDKIAVCKKIVQNVREKVVIKRSCAFESRDGRDECSPNGGPSFVRTVFCETCRSDGCNGNINTDYNALAEDFPPEEIRQYTKPPQPPITEDDGVEDGDDVDLDDLSVINNNKPHDRLVTKPDDHTQAPQKAGVPGSSADRVVVFSTLSLISVALSLANLLSH